MGDARHTRPKGRAGLRRAGLRHMSVTMLVMLVIQYGLGIILNLYVEVPASDAHAGILSEIATAPAVLTFHAVLGIALVYGTMLWRQRRSRAREQVSERPTAQLYERENVNEKPKPIGDDGGASLDAKGPG